MSTKVELDRPDSDHDHWLEISRIRDKFKVVKKDSEPVFNEEIYYYSLREDGSLSIDRGTKSCSGAGKSRPTTPSERLDEEIGDAIQSIAA